MGTEQAVHFIEHDPKAEDVAARVNRLPLSLLGRHISNRAEAFRRNHDVPGLGIAMDDPGGVCAGQSVGDLDGLLQNSASRIPSFGISRSSVFPATYSMAMKSTPPSWPMS